jgi:hypothetical protein
MFLILVHKSLLSLSFFKSTGKMSTSNSSIYSSYFETVIGHFLKKSFHFSSEFPNMCIIYQVKP